MPLAARAVACACAATAASILAPIPAFTQQIADDFPFPQSLVEDVLPGATSFEVRDGEPRVIVGYAADAPDEDALVGYAFLTSDVPPEELGYNGPIEVLVGMDREGTLTGVRVTHYVESYIRTRGDFLRTPGYEAQFTGKSISDPFRAKRDVRVVSRATISVSAMSRGIRASARRVYANYLATRPSAESGGSLLTIGMEELDELSWSDMVAGGLVPQIHVLENNVTRIVLSFAHIRSDSVGEMMVGRSRFAEVAEQLGERVQEDPLMLVGVDGALALLFYPRTLSLVQGADTIDMDNPDVVMLGEPRSGMVQGQFRNVGVMAVPGALDVEQAFDIHFDLRPGMGLYTTAYPPPQLPARVVAEDVPLAEDPDPAEPVAQGSDPAGGAETVGGAETTADEPETARGDPSPVPSDPEQDPAEAGAVASDVTEDVAATAQEDVVPEAAPGDDPEVTDAGLAAEAVPPGGPPSPEDPAGESSSPDDPAAAPVPVDQSEAADAAAGDPAPSANPSEAEENPSATVQPAAPPDLDFSLAEEQTVLERTLARTSPAEVAWMLGLLALVTVAFFLKRDRLRWVALVATFLYLGWFDGGFLSVSHITAVISVGPAVFLEDIPLLLFVVFTVVTTLLVGRVFCGFLCPFGVLQDFLEKVVPRKFKRELPRALHERLYLVKYVCLAAILLPALAGSRASIFSFFEPFGTVFFLSSSIVLWGIAGGILVASAIVPRFYCRYACPLGAALAVASTVSPFRIRRVEHCDHCKVCEQACPTGAIEGPRIDFRECVRCNICEAKLIEQAGVCRHEIDDVRGRLVQLKVAPSAGVEAGARIGTGA
ncbi:MAG: 4Fe-4S binding protein [Gammaproteobacteria bacterium]|nr:4Fe-4S binding protein [Gammaproteobacteria bacterium]MYC52774.1 4Fe-4S binding protein [Gammaproteobacteria bacterium]